MGGPPLGSEPDPARIEMDGRASGPSLPGRPGPGPIRDWAEPVRDRPDPGRPSGWAEAGPVVLRPFHRARTEPNRPGTAKPEMVTGRTGRSTEPGRAGLGPEPFPRSPPTPSRGFSLPGPSVRARIGPGRPGSLLRPAAPRGRAASTPRPSDSDAARDHLRGGVSWWSMVVARWQMRRRPPAEGWPSAASPLTISIMILYLVCLFIQVNTSDLVTISHCYIL